MAVTLNPVSEVRTFTTSSGRTVFVLNGQSGFDLDALVAACHDASCRPPTSGGTGGSRRRGGFTGVSSPREREYPNAPRPKFTQLTKSEMDYEGVGWEDLPTNKRSEKFVASWYDAKLPDGFSVKVKADRISSAHFEIEGTIHNEFGRQVGSFERTVHFNATMPYEVRETDQYGQYTTVRKFIFGTSVEHSSLILDPSAQGHGIADALNAHAMQSYHEYGVDHIKVHAGFDVGGYTWAVAGFRIDDGNQDRWGDYTTNRHDAIEDLLREGATKLVSLVADGVVNTKQRDDAIKQMEALREASKAGEDIQPIHIASIGEATGRFSRKSPKNVSYTTWIGKEMLLGTSWSGYYYLTREPLTASVTIGFGQEFTMTEHTHIPQEEGDINATRDWTEIHEQVAEYVAKYGQKA